MTIDPLRVQDTKSQELNPMPVQMEIQRDMLKQTMGAEDSQKQLLQLLANAQPQQAIQKTAQEQISKGHLDITV
jgi:hypothetical protein